MELNKNIIEILKYLYCFGNKEVKDSLKITDTEASVISNNEILARVKNNSIELLNGYDIQKNISTNAHQENTISLEKVKRFLENISKSIVRLNHVGISYSCTNLQNELKKYIRILDPKFKLFEEESNSNYNKWYFIGNRSNSSIFEIVLAERKNFLNDSWTPHFQIDIDTNLDPENIEREFKSIFGRGFDWSLNIPGVGIVLGMKILGVVNGTKVILGVGTTKRDTEYHRKNILKDIA